MNHRTGGYLLAATIGLMSTAAAIPQAWASDAESERVTVLTRNIYLGADVTTALELIPDLPSAAQFMWDQVAATDFDSRVPLLARELDDLKPDVVAIQEATQWLCRPGVFGSTTVVFDFTQQLLEEAQRQGAPYVVASHDGEQAYNPGYAIPAIPLLTEVTDPATFQPLFGSDTASCGFTIADALLVRADIADQVVGVGTVDYGAKYAVVPWLFEVPRGFAWADISFGDATARFVTTHLESVWDPDTTPFAALQGDELISATASWQMPLAVMGDFNMDPRDPRPIGAPNPGGQPDATTGCAPQPQTGLPQGAISDCNTYWKMLDAGFTDAGPDALDPANATWGASALLAGPDPTRLVAAPGNPYGYTDRLDYVFVRNGVSVQSAELIGEAWPSGDPLWNCDDPEQRANAEVVAAQTNVALGSTLCLPTDHAGLLVTLDVPVTDVGEFPATPEPAPDLRVWVAGVALLILIVGGLIGLARRRRRRTAQSATT